MLHDTILLPIDYAAHRADAPKTACELWSYALPTYGDVTDIARPAVIILPGGAYAWLSDREGEPVASAFLAAGISAFVLRYTVAGNGSFPCALIEAFEAVQYELISALTTTFLTFAARHCSRKASISLSSEL